MKRTDKPQVFTVASVLAHLMSDIALTEDAQPIHMTRRGGASTTSPSRSDGGHTPAETSTGGARRSTGPQASRAWDPHRPM